MATMVDGFYWTRVVSKQLRFLYEEPALSPLPAHLSELARKTEASLAALVGATPNRDVEGTARSLYLPEPPPAEVHAAVRNELALSGVESAGRKTTP
jgi:hypothetical protein